MNTLRRKNPAARLGPVLAALNAVVWLGCANETAPRLAQVAPDPREAAPAAASANPESAPQGSPKTFTEPPDSGGAPDVDRHAARRVNPAAQRAVPPLVRSRALIDAEIAREKAELARGERRAEEDEEGEEEAGEEEHEEATGAAEAARQMHQARLDADGEIKPGALLRAKEHADKMLEMQVPRSDGGVADGGIWLWDWLGPGNIGGRIRAICFRSDSEIFIGGVAGGIWRSTDGGGSWTHMSDFLPSLAVTSIVLDPTNPNRMYAATGETIGGGPSLQGAGVFLSTNGGTIWSQLTSTSTWVWVNRLAHHPTQANTLFAAVGNPNSSTPSGLYKSTNGGSTWTQVATGNFFDVKFSPASPSTLLAVSFDGTTGKVWLSTSNGNSGTWTDQSTGGQKLPTNSAMCETAFGPNGKMWVLMNRNGGEVWYNLQTAWIRASTGLGVFQTDGGGNQGNYDITIWASPTDSNLLVIGGIDIYRSRNAGLTFIKISDWSEYHEGDSAHADQHTIVAPPGYGGATHAVYFGNDGGIQRADDIYDVEETDGWTNLASNLGITQFYAGATTPGGEIVFGGTQDNSVPIFESRSGDPPAWYQDFTGDGGFAGVGPYLDDWEDWVLYTETQLLHFKRRFPVFGWDEAIDGLDDAENKNQTLFIAPFMVDPNFPATVIAGGQTIWRTYNGAEDWNSIRTPIPTVTCSMQTFQPMCSAIAIAKSDSNRIWVGYNWGTVSRSMNGGASWTDVDDNGSTPIPDCRYVTDILINPSNPDEVFVTIGGNATDTVWHTSDNGLTWDNRNGGGATQLPAIQINTITHHPSNLNFMYVGTDLGVFASEDRGLTWKKTPRYNWNDGPANTIVSDLFWDGYNQLYAATHGRGMFRTRPLWIVYADKANNTGVEDGSFLYPYNTVQEALSVAGQGTTIIIRAGDYVEGPKTFDKRGTVRAIGGTARVR